jgi:hypothetical protein
MKVFLIPLTLFSVGCGQLLAQPLPAGCGITLATISVASGSPAYLRLCYEIEALTAAQDGVTSMNKALNEFNAATAPPLALSALITGTTEARDALHCAAAVMTKYASVNDRDRTVKQLLILAYNQEAEVTMDLQADTKKRFLGSAEKQSNAAIVRDAEHLSAMTATQHDAAESLLQGTAMSLMLAVDLTDATAKNTPKTLLSCNEFDELRTRSAALAKTGTSAYTDSASLFVTFLDGHQCQQ